MPHHSAVLWVGLSEKPVKGGALFSPLSPDTASGKVIVAIERQHSNTTFVRTNLVRMAPLDTRGKLRYPTREECEEYYPHLVTEIATLKPSLVLLLGRQVTTFVLKHLHNNATFPASFSYEAVRCGDIEYAGVHHPSYVSIYRRKAIDQYEHAIATLIERHP